LGLKAKAKAKDLDPKVKAKAQGLESQGQGQGQARETQGQGQGQGLEISRNFSQVFLHRFFTVKVLWVFLCSHTIFCVNCILSIYE